MNLQIELIQNNKNEQKVVINKIKEFQYIYLIYLREFINSNQDIYKIGKTKQLNNNRFKQYPKGTIILYQSIVISQKKN